MQEETNKNESPDIPMQSGYMERVGDTKSDIAVLQSVLNMISLGTVTMNQLGELKVTGEHFKLLYSETKKIVSLEVLGQDGCVVFVPGDGMYEGIVDALTMKSKEYMDERRECINEASKLETAYSEEKRLVSEVKDAKKSYENMAKEVVDRLGV